MIYTVQGSLQEKQSAFCILLAGSFGIKVQCNERTLRSLPAVGSPVTLYTYLQIREEQMDLYGFLSEAELHFFELLRSVSGVGPKTALGVLNHDTVEHLTAAILEKKSDLLTKASGIGKKTAERIILELQNKVHLSESKTVTDRMDADLEAEEALVGLGYARGDVKNALREVSTEEKTFEARFKAALRALSRFKKM